MRKRIAMLLCASFVGVAVPWLPASASHLSFTQIVTGTWHTCGLEASGDVYCWGNNDYGQLGDGTTLVRTFPTPVAGLPGGQVVDVAAGWGHTCALTVAGNAFCWGYGGYGQLGNGATPILAQTPVGVSPTAALPTGSIADLDAEGLHSCAVSTSAKAFCWGMNNEGQLGNGTTTDSSLPVPVSSGAGLTPGTVAYVDAGLDYSCAMTTKAEAFCWGLNNTGQLGNGSFTDSSVPVQVATGAGLTAGTVSMISSGGWHSCAVSTGGDAYCWGSNWEGRLGNGTTGFSNVPVAVAVGAGLLPGTVATIGAGGYHSCAITTGGDAYCWGNNESGELGEGTVLLDRTQPVAVYEGTGLSPGSANLLSVGWRHTCAGSTAQETFCWGEGSRGQRGDGTLLLSPAPLRVN